MVRSKILDITTRPTTVFIRIDECAGGDIRFTGRNFNIAW